MGKSRIVIRKGVPYNISIIRNYQKIYSYGNETYNSTQDVAHFHPAVITTEHGYQVLASCVTFAPSHKVPPGTSHKVNLTTFNGWYIY